MTESFAHKTLRRLGYRIDGWDNQVVLSEFQDAIDTLIEFNFRVDSKGKPCGRSWIARSKDCGKGVSGETIGKVGSALATAAVVGGGAAYLASRQKAKAPTAKPSVIIPPASKAPEIPQKQESQGIQKDQLKSKTSIEKPNTVRDLALTYSIMGAVGAGVWAFNKYQRSDFGAPYSDKDLDPRVNGEYQPFDGKDPTGKPLDPIVAAEIERVSRELYDSQIRNGVNPAERSTYFEEAYSVRLDDGVRSAKSGGPKRKGTSVPMPRVYPDGRHIPKDVNDVVTIDSVLVHSHPSSSSLSYPDIWESSNKTINRGSANYNTSFCIAVDVYGNRYSGTLTDEERAKQPNVLLNSLLIAKSYEFEKTFEQVSKSALSRRQINYLQDNPQVSNFVWSHATNLLRQEAGQMNYSYQLSPPFREIEEYYKPLFDAMREKGRKLREQNNRQDSLDTYFDAIESEEDRILIDTFVSPFSSESDFDWAEDEVFKLPESRAKEIALDEIEFCRALAGLLEQYFPNGDRLDAQGKPCGKSWISANKECGKGTDASVKREPSKKSSGNAAKVAAGVVGAAALAGAGAYAYNKLKDNPSAKPSLPPSKVEKQSPSSGGKKKIATTVATMSAIALTGGGYLVAQRIKEQAEDEAILNMDQEHLRNLEFDNGIDQSVAPIEFDNGKAEIVDASSLSKRERRKLIKECDRRTEELARIIEGFRQEQGDETITFEDFLYSNTHKDPDISMLCNSLILHQMARVSLRHPNGVKMMRVIRDKENGSLQGVASMRMGPIGPHVSGYAVTIENLSDRALKKIESNGFKVDRSKKYDGDISRGFLKYAIQASIDAGNKGAILCNPIDDRVEKLYRYVGFKRSRDMSFTEASTKEGKRFTSSALKKIGPRYGFEPPDDVYKPLFLTPQDSVETMKRLQEAEQRAKTRGDSSWLDGYYALLEEVGPLQAIDDRQKELYRETFRQLSAPEGEPRSDASDDKDAVDHLIDHYSGTFDRLTDKTIDAALDYIDGFEGPNALYELKDKLANFYEQMDSVSGTRVLQEMLILSDLQGRGEVLDETEDS